MFQTDYNTTDYVTVIIFIDLGIHCIVLKYVPHIASLIWLFKFTNSWYLGRLELLCFAILAAHF